MNNKTINYVSGKINHISQKYISGQLDDKNSTREIAQLVYNLEIEDLKGEKHILVTQHKRFLEQKSYAHFFYDESNVITDVFKCYEKKTKYLVSGENSQLFGSLFLACAILFWSLVLPNLSDLRIPYGNSIFLNIWTAIPFALTIIFMLLSGFLLTISISYYISSLMEYKKILKYRKFASQVDNSNKRIAEKIAA